MKGIESKAWEQLEKAMVDYRGQPVGTVAAAGAAANYDQVFVRDFFVSALAFLMDGKTEIVRNFLLTTLELQSIDRHMDCFHPGCGMMPASFRVVRKGDGTEQLVADFGEHAIARVTPIDSGFWWLYLLYVYHRATGDDDLVRSEAVQRGIRLILHLCLPPRHEMLPTLLVPDGAFMVDRRLGVYGHPLDVQVLFHLALRAASILLDPDDPLRAAAIEREAHLTYHLRTYYWLDLTHLNRIYRYRVEEFGEDAANRFNIYPGTIPRWLFEWMPRNGGYFAGNLGPGRLDCRFFSQGNLLAILCGLADSRQAQAILELFNDRRNDLLGETPVKLIFPAIEGRDWELVSGCDPKNTPWSYHNGGNWPFLLWLLAAAAMRTGHEALVEQVIDSVETRLLEERWPEYYDGHGGRFIGKEAQLDQTWTIAGYLTAKRLLHDGRYLDLLTFGADSRAVACAVGGDSSN